MRPLIAFLIAAAPLLAQPRRIVSTSPSITETLFALGLGDRVVGVSNFCHYPPEAAARTHVGSYLRPNIESIAALTPDLVIFHATTDSIGPRLTQLKLKSLQVEQGNLAATFTMIRAIGEAAGAGERARSLEMEIRNQLDAIRNRARSRPRRTLVFIVGRSPGKLDGLVAVGRDSFLNELIEIANGTNPLATSPAAYPRISLESLLALNPDVLVDMGDMADTVGVSDDRLRETAALWTRYSTLRAVANKRVFPVASDVFVVPGPRIAEAAARFEQMMQ